MPPKKTKQARAPAKLLPAPLLWSEKKAPGRGPSPTLTTDQIARAAIQIADSGGLEAVSMQRIARKLKVSTMALYRYVSSKAELIGLMVDVAGGAAPDLSDGAGGWRSRLTDWTIRCSSIYREHPWFLQAATTSRRIMGPNELAWLDAALGVLAETGLPAHEQHPAFLLLIGHVRSNTEFMSAATQGPSAKEWSSAMSSLLAEHKERYPSLMTAIRSGAFSQPPDAGIDFGLECILDGIESLARKGRKRS